MENREPAVAAATATNGIDVIDLTVLRPTDFWQVRLDRATARYQHR